MRFVVGRLYSIYVATAFVGVFLLILPLQWLFSTRLAWHNYALSLNTVWAWSFLTLSGVPCSVHGKKNLPSGQFIFCANHFSYLDIPAMGLIGVPFKFFGKASLKKLPVFGWMYDRLHVTVERTSFKSRAAALHEARRMLDAGFHMNFFPEGGVRVKKHPELAPFHDGAFRLSVEKQLPIVPVILSNNHRVWPYDRRQLFFGGKCVVKICEPMFPQDVSEQEIQALKERVRTFMQAQLDDAIRLNSQQEIATTHES